MTKIKYTQKQIEELKKNQYVEKCSELYITFTNKIKYESVVLWETGLTCKEVFKKLQFPEYIINSDLPSKNINRWNRTINEKGKDSFDKRKKGRKKDYKNIDINNMTKYEIDDYYKIRIKYLEEENKLLKGIKKS